MELNYNKFIFKHRYKNNGEMSRCLAIRKYYYYQTTGVGARERRRRRKKEETTYIDTSSADFIKYFLLSFSLTKLSVSCLIILVRGPEFLVCIHIAKVINNTRLLVKD